MIYSRLAELFGPDSGLVLPIANLEHEGDCGNASHLKLSTHVFSCIYLTER